MYKYDYFIVAFYTASKIQIYISFMIHGYVLFLKLANKMHNWYTLNIINREKWNILIAEFIKEILNIFILINK